MVGKMVAVLKEGTENPTGRALLPEIHDCVR